MATKHVYTRLDLFLKLGNFPGHFQGAGFSTPPCEGKNVSVSYGERGGVEAAMLEASLQVKASCFIDRYPSFSVYYTDLKFFFVSLCVFGLFPLLPVEFYLFFSVLKK